ncbi:MAG TPA: cellulase family glycosylhydrolase [Gaiellaceae bacterium]|nr:cellulase family glycosylhydrolase [Gaiellaceae bacterium]
MGLTTRNLLAAGAIFVLAAVSASVAVAAGHRAGHTRTYSTPATGRLATAIADPALFGGSQTAAAFARTRAAGATYVRLTVTWRSIAPASPPAGFVATDPTSPGYSWGALDAVVDAAESAGLTPILDVLYAPGWAYDTTPTTVNGGSPNVAALGDFAKALATHYDGLTPGTPAEHIFQVWNEPNLSLDMSPVSATKYRDLVNAVADSVHAVDQANLVVAGGLDPYAHPKGKHQQWYAVSPLAYMRSLLCLSKGAHPHPTCHVPIRFDIWSHHPYSHGGPFARAKVAGDVEIGDLPKMRALLNAGVRLGNIVSQDPIQFWVTEFGWNTNPPRKHSPSLALAARWTAESLHQLWLSGVSLVTWFLLDDMPAPSLYKSGLYFQSSSVDNARPKAVRTAFRFPFVAYRHRSTVAVWGRDATSDAELVTVQRRHGKKGRWRTVAFVKSNGDGIFRAKLKLKASKGDWLRAVARGSGTSLAFSLAPGS